MSDLSCGLASRSHEWPHLHLSLSDSTTIRAVATIARVLGGELCLPIGDLGGIAGAVCCCRFNDSTCERDKDDDHRGDGPAAHAALLGDEAHLSERRVPSGAQVPPTVRVEVRCRCAAALTDCQRWHLAARVADEAVASEGRSVTLLCDNAREGPDRGEGVRDVGACVSLDASDAHGDEEAAGAEVSGGNPALLGNVDLDLEDRGDRHPTRVDREGHTEEQLELERACTEEVVDVGVVDDGEEEQVVNDDHDQGWPELSVSE
mmetsp:Transcript_60379/g.119673  ORF Transcript_60379/g.119673 Transcript_60379/m.119673 type:complete len:262 (+) Transcript_60379:411-1196(+)